MTTQEEARETLQQADNIVVKGRRGGSRRASGAAKADINDLLNDDEVEDRSEVMSIRITPTARRKIEEIWLKKREKNKKLKESTIAADILMKVLESYE